MSASSSTGNGGMAGSANDSVVRPDTTGQKSDSIISSGGAIGKQFNPDGSIGQIGEKVGGPFSKDGIIGGQFDASKNGIAGQVEKLVDGPSKRQ